MKWLVIINNAVFAGIYKEIAKKLLSEGQEVVIATDCRLTNEKYELETLGCDVFIFTDFNLKEPMQEYEANHWLVHSDFDRNNYYDYLGKITGEYWPRIGKKLWHFYDMIFSRCKVDFIFYENISSGFSHVASEVAKNYNVQYLGLTSSRIPGHVLFSGLDDDVSLKIKNHIESNEEYSNDDINYINDYIANIVYTVPDYMKTNGLSSANFLPKIFKKRKLNNLTTTLKYSIKTETDSFQMGTPLIKAFNSNLREFKRFVTSRIIKNYYSAIPTTGEFYLYPLHYHPESSTSILAKYYDEYNLIKNIAFSLPKNRYLIVKDHLSAFGYEGLDFYRKLRALPNVILANPNENSKVIIKKSLGIFTLTSTVGYEAIILNKPVVIFGDVFYQEHPLVYKCNGYADINNGYEFIENNKNNFDNEEYTKKFLLAYKAICFPLAISYTGNELQRQNLADDIVRLLLKVSCKNGVIK